MPDIRLMGVTYPDVPAVDLPQNGGGTARFYILNNQNKTVTPTESQQIITADSGYTGLGQVTVGAISDVYVGSGITRRTSSDLTASGRTVTAPAGYYESAATKQVQQGTEGTPTATKGAVSNHAVTITPSVTNSEGYISGGTRTGTAVTVTAAELVSGTLTPTSGGTKDVTNYASVEIPLASAPTSTWSEAFTTIDGSRKWRNNVAVSTATSGWKQTGTDYFYSEYRNAVPSNTTVTPTPSSQTIGGANWMMEGAVTINPIPSQYIVPTGNLAITQNGNNIDVSQYATVSVNVSGGGGSSVQVDSVVRDAGGDEYTAIFTGLKGEPTSFSIYVDEQISPSATAVISSMVYDGSSTHIQTLTNTANAQVSYASSGVSYTYNNGTLTVTSSSLQFADTDYVLAYSYGGSSANIYTEDVQVGSGATSITFTGLEDLPIAWCCIFKSNFSTSSGYQRVIFTQWDGNGSDHVVGLAMDSSAHPNATYWSYTYNNGSLTITSAGTNQGGYFHQPGYYQLTYVIGEASPYQKVSKTYYASTSAQSEKIEPSTGYDAMSEVNISIPAVTQTNLIAANIKSGTTVTISNGSTNLWSVTGTYSGGGSGATIATGSATLSQAGNSISFTGLTGTPKAWFIRCTTQMTSSSTTYYYVVDARYNGTNTQATLFRMGSTRRTQNQTTGISYTYSNGTLTVSSTATSASSTPGYFYNGTYELVYTY